MNERIVCLDIGDARIGVAVSDATRTIASPVEVIRSVGWGPDTRKIAEICRRYDTTEVLSGLPLNMDGTEGFQAKKVRALCEQLEKAGLTVYYHDERLTTVSAQDALIEGGMRREERRNHVDKVAAAVILQNWLDSRRQGGNQMADNEIMEPGMDGEEDNIIELVGENGETEQFELVATFDYENETYLALMVLDEEHTVDDDEGEIVLMQVDTDDSGEECYIPVEDEDLQNRLFDRFLELMNEEEDEDGEE